jgi:hypothetical protein
MCPSNAKTSGAKQGAIAAAKAVDRRDESQERYLFRVEAFKAEQEDSR